jgi:hypothetical protein
VQPCYEKCLRDYQTEAARECGDEWIAIKDCELDLECEDLFGDCGSVGAAFDECVQLARADDYCESQCPTQDRDECIAQYLETGTCDSGGETPDAGAPDGAIPDGGVPVFKPGPTCIAFCAKAVGECDALSDVEGFEDADEASCRQGCEASLALEGAKSEACGDAVEAVFECVAALDCKGVDDWLQRVPSDAYPCLSEVATVGAVCV